MQTTKLLLAGLLLLWATSALLSCRKEDLNGSHAVADSTAVFSAMVAGVNWQTDSVSAFLACAAADQPRIMTITAMASQEVISISLRDTARGANDSTMSVASYPVGGWGDAAVFEYAKNSVLVGRSLVWQQEGSSTSGQAVVTASDGVNKNISGTFSFTAKLLVVDSLGFHVDSVNVTNGVFKNIPYSYFKHP